MRNIKILLLFLQIFTLSCNSRVESILNYNGEEIVIDSLTTFLKQKMQRDTIPGLAIAVINEGEMVYHRTLGYANLEQYTPVTESTIFEGASLSKPVFAFFIMKLVQEGKLDIDTPLHTYWSYPDIVDDPRSEKITARMVLSHRSGLPNWRNDDGVLKINFEPGTDYMYSGEGYQYLALVLRENENTDWMGLEKIFQKEIAQPLGLNHMVFVQNEYTKTHKSDCYDTKGERLDWKKVDWRGLDEFGAPYSIHTEAVDFAKWMIAIMNQELLTERSYRELFKKHSQISDDTFYTLGFFTEVEPYHNLYYHGGSNDGFRCGFIFDIKKKWGFVVFTNSEKGDKMTTDLFKYFEPNLK